MSESDRPRFRQAIDAVETAYEFMLAYAAQGRADDTGPGAPPVRDQLRALRAALEDVTGAIAEETAAGVEAVPRFLRVLEADVEAAVAKVDLVLAAPAISSQLVDNLNASIHLRAVLTDLFLVDEFVKTLRRQAAPSSSS